jgi:hypothetical protein
MGYYGKNLNFLNRYKNKGTCVPNLRKETELLLHSEILVNMFGIDGKLYWRIEDLYKAVE